MVESNPKKRTQVEQLLRLREDLKTPTLTDNLKYMEDEGAPIGTNVEDVMTPDQGQGMAPPPNQGQGMAPPPNQGQGMAPSGYQPDEGPPIGTLGTNVEDQIDPSPAALEQMLASEERDKQLIPNQDLHDMLFTAVDNTGDSIAAMGIQKLLENANLDIMGMMQAEEGGRLNRESGGGLMKLAAGGEFSGRVPGDGHGMEDNVYMPIKEGPEQVATLAVSPTEYVVDSHTMAALGNGNPDNGADVMDEVVKRVRQQAFGTRQQPNEINGLAALSPMIERV